MIAADRGDASVMDLRTTDAALLKRGAKLRPVAFGFCQENQIRRLKPGFDLIDGSGQRSRRRINTRMSHDGKKFVYTRPRNRPRRLRFSEFRNLAQSCIMPWRVLAMSVDQQIRIERDHPPLPWQIGSRILSHVASSTPGSIRLPLNVALRSRNIPRLFRSATIRLRPCSTYARTVVPSFAASLLASSKSESDISMVVFIWVDVPSYMVVRQRCRMYGNVKSKVSDLPNSINQLRERCALGATG